MTINNEHTPKPSLPHFQSQFEEQEDDTPGRLPAVKRSVSSQQPARAQSSRPMPAQQYQEQQFFVLSQQATRPLPPQRPPASPPPPFISPAQVHRPKRRRLAIPVGLALVLLAILVILG